MTAILFDSTVTRKSSQSFGRGIDRERPTPFEPSSQDRAWAAESFDSLDQARYQAEKNARLEDSAREAEWNDQFRLAPGLCEWCGEPSDWLDPVHKLCAECMTDAENSTIACMNKVAMGEYRVF
jgi:hypothetical protein